MYNAHYIMIIMQNHCEKFGKIGSIIENVTCRLVRDNTTTFGVPLKQFIYLNINIQMHTCLFICKYAGIIYIHNAITYITLFYTIGIILYIILCIIHIHLTLFYEHFCRILIISANTFFFIKIASIIFTDSCVLICINLNFFLIYHVSIFQLL